MSLGYRFLSSPDAINIRCNFLPILPSGRTVKLPARVIAYKVTAFSSSNSANRQEAIDPLAGVDKNDYYAVAKALGIKD